MPGTVPVWLVVGFLGAGKTTLLRRLVKSPRGRKLAYVVNEFSNVDVDAGLVAQEGGVSISVAGGSIFCHCKVTEYLNVLERISGGLPDTDGGRLRPEGVVIEASGMADPRSMRRLLAESGLCHRRLCPDRNRPQEGKQPSQPRHHSTDSQRHSFRESPLL